MTALEKLCALLHHRMSSKLHDLFWKHPLLVVVLVSYSSAVRPNDPSVRLSSTCDCSAAGTGVSNGTY
jgi:hypothetical protein